MSAACGNGRGDDSASCKRNTGNIAMEDMTVSVNPALDPTGSKANRGFSHVVLWSMLAPMSLIDEYRREGKIDE